MGAPSPGGEGWGVLWCVSDCFGGTQGNQNGLSPQELHELPPDLATRPISPPHRLSRNRRSDDWFRLVCRVRGRHLTDRWRGRRRGRARPEHGTHSSWLFGGARFLTLFPQRARTAMANAACIQHAQGAVTLLSAFLYVQRMARGATQRPIGLRDKRRTRKPMSKRRLGEFRWPVGREQKSRVLRRLRRLLWRWGKRCHRGVQSGRGFWRLGSRARRNRGRSPIRRGIILRRRFLHP